MPSLMCKMAKTKICLLFDPTSGGALSPIHKFLDIYTIISMYITTIILSYFAYRILSENTPHFILLCSSYIIIICIPTHRKKKHRPLNKQEKQKMVLAAIIIKSLFSSEKKVPPP